MLSIAPSEALRRYNLGPPTSLSIKMATSTFADRPLNTLILFDVDGTLTPARQVSFPCRDFPSQRV